tara:strand:+ start:4181 stop:4408 length:228 start_codon:yes stop_codon:yes gene_type:complete
MRDVQFNHSIDGSITIRVDDINSGYINYSEKPIVEVVVFYHDFKTKVNFKSVEEATEWVKMHFKELDNNDKLFYY